MACQAFNLPHFTDTTALSQVAKLNHICLVSSVRSFWRQIFTSSALTLPRALWGTLICFCWPKTEFLLAILCSVKLTHSVENGPLSQWAGSFTPRVHCHSTPPVGNTQTNAYPLYFDCWRFVWLFSFFFVRNSLMEFWRSLCRSKGLFLNAGIWKSNGCIKVLGNGISVIETLNKRSSSFCAGPSVAQSVCALAQRNAPMHFLWVQVQIMLALSASNLQLDCPLSSFLNAVHCCISEIF